MLGLHHIGLAPRRAGGALLPSMGPQALANLPALADALFFGRREHRA